MAILTPNAKIAGHWAGALQASLKRASLERFLRFRALPVAPAGPARDSDNLTQATMYILGEGMGSYSRGLSGGLTPLQQALIGQMACQMCHGLAELIGQPRSWRIAALVSTTKQLSAGVDLSAAAKIAATAAYDFTAGRVAAHGSDLGKAATAAVNNNSDTHVQEIAGLISRVLADSHGLSATAAWTPTPA